MIRPLSPGTGGAIVVGLLLLPGTAAAQGRHFGRPELPRPESPADTRPAPEPPRDRPPATPLVPEADRDLFRAGSDTYAPRYDRLLPSPIVGGVWVPGYAAVGSVYFDPPHRAHAGMVRSTEPYGYLRLDVEPGDAEVYVDGYYAGVADDFLGTGVTSALEPRPHRVELRAAGFETIVFDVRPRPGATIAFRRQLRKIEAHPAPVAPAAVTAPPAAPRKTLYVIPGCYAGDKPPRPDQLPAGCDARKIRTLPS